MWLVKVVLFLIDILECPLSFFLNSCIVLIHMKNLRKGMKTSPSDLIQLVMGGTNITLRGLMIVNSTGFWFPMYYQVKIMHTMAVLVPFHLYFNYWLIAWLSTLYWTSIANLQHQLFVWIKRGLSSFTPHILLWSALVSLAIALPPIWGLHFGVSGQNSTLLEMKISLTGFNFITLACASICLSLSVILVSLTLTVFSLLNHVWSMKTNSSGLGCPSVQAHVSAVRTMTLLLLLSVIISSADLIIFQPPPDFHESVITVAWLMLGLFPTLEASIIIQSSPKLRKVFLQTFCAGKLVEDNI